jgi:hypothetical protein
MKEKLRRIAISETDGTVRSKHDGEELVGVGYYPYSMTAVNMVKCLEAEAIAKQYLLDEVRMGNLDALIDMRYPKKLTEYNTRLMNALVGRRFNEIWEYSTYSNTFKKEHPERSHEVEKLSDLLKTLKKEVKGKKGNRKAKKIIRELQVRFRGLDGYQFKKLHSRFMGSKYDWMGVKDGKAILYDAKSSLFLNEGLAKCYWKFSKAGVPFFLLILDKQDGVLRSFEMKRLTSKMHSKQGDYYIIPRAETVRIKIIPRESEEPS